MQKKYFINPALTVVRIQNDIIATSGEESMEWGGSNLNGGPTAAETQGRYAWDEF